jgi:hypothetical protein
MLKKTFAFVVLVVAVAVFGSPAGASSPGSGAITKSKKSLSWSGASFVLSDPAPDPSGLGLYAPTCKTDSMCDHFALKITLGDNAKVQIKITTPRPNPPGSFLGVQSLQPATGDDYDLFVYDPSGALITGTKGATEKGNESVTINHRKKFNGKAYDVAVRAWAVMPGSSYTGAVKALSVGR